MQSQCNFATKITWTRMTICYFVLPSVDITMCNWSCYLSAARRASILEKRYVSVCFQIILICGKEIRAFTWNLLPIDVFHIPLKQISVLSKSCWIWLWIDKPSLPTIKVFRLIISPFHCYIIHVDGRDQKKLSFKWQMRIPWNQTFRNERVSHAKVFPLDDLTTLTLKCWHVTWHQWYKKSANWPPNYHKTAKTFPQIFWPLIQWISWL